MHHGYRYMPNAKYPTVTRRQYVQSSRINGSRYSLYFEIMGQNTCETTTKHWTHGTAYCPFPFLRQKSANKAPRNPSLYVQASASTWLVVTRAGHDQERWIGEAKPKVWASVVHDCRLCCCSWCNIISSLCCAQAA